MAAAHDWRVPLLRIMACAALCTSVPAARADTVVANVAAATAPCQLDLARQECQCVNYCYIVVTAPGSAAQRESANVTRYNVDLGLPTEEVYSTVEAARDAWRAPCFTAPAAAVSTSGEQLPAAVDASGPYLVDYPEGYYTAYGSGEYVERLPCSTHVALPHPAVKCTIYVHAAFSSGATQQSFDDANDCTPEQAAALGVVPTAPPLYPETAAAAGLAHGVTAAVAAVAAFAVAALRH